MNYDTIRANTGVRPYMLSLCRYRASLISITESAPTTASDCRRPTTSTDRAVSRKRCGRTRFIEEMSRVCRLIHNFADDSFRCCQLFQEKVNLFSKGVNDSSKVSARLCRFVCKELIRENACQPHQEKYQKLSARLCRLARPRISQTPSFHKLSDLFPTLHQTPCRKGFAGNLQSRFRP